jgi:hypothetical protein
MTRKIYLEDIPLDEAWRRFIAALDAAGRWQPFDGETMPVADALGRAGNRLAPHFLDNTDPDGFDRVLGGLGEALAGTLAVVISKSGGTPETRNGMLEAAAAYGARGLDFGLHAVAVTQEKSALDRWPSARVPPGSRCGLV